MDPTTQNTPLSPIPTNSLSQLVMQHQDPRNCGLPKTCRELINIDNISSFLLRMKHWLHSGWIHYQNEKNYGNGIRDIIPIIFFYF